MQLLAVQVLNKPEYGSSCQSSAAMPPTALLDHKGDTPCNNCRRQDEGKLKEMRLAVEKLTQQVATQKDVLEAEITDTQAAQIQLDRAAQDFRQLHQERQDLIRQWDEARDAMKTRDEAIQVCQC